MYRCVLYHSRACVPASQDSAIYVPSRVRNKSLGLSGTLHREGDIFTQIIEGPDAAVDELMHDIRADPRHTDIDVVLNETIDARRFDKWPMGYSSDRDVTWSDWAARHGAGLEIRRAKPPGILSFLAEYHVLEDPRNEGLLSLIAQSLTPGRGAQAQDGGPGSS